MSGTLLDRRQEPLGRRKAGALPLAPACDVQEPEILRTGLPFGKFG